MKKLVLFFSLLLFISCQLSAQCDIAFDQIDEFDSTRTLSAKPISVGYMIPSKFETMKGPKLIEEAQILFSYAENDSINSFFMTIAIPEYNYETIETGPNVILRLSDSTVVTLYNVPDSGTFDSNTNMRLYQHTCVVSLDVFNRLTLSTIEKIRIDYKKQKRTLTISKEQQEALRSALRCVGKSAGLYPIKP